MAVENEKLSTSVNTGTSISLDCNEINYWNSLSNELIEKILLFLIKESGLQTCQTYLNIIQIRERLVYLTLLYFSFLEINVVVKPRQNS